MSIFDEKRGLEIGALNEFSKALAALLGDGRFCFHELRNPPEPDGFCSFDGEPLHVEVVHFYGTQSDAKLLLGRTEKSAATPKEQLLSFLEPLDARLLIPFNSLLADKATKKYHASRVWLLIRSAFPLWNVEDFKEYQANIAVPLTHPFEQIWLLCGPYASSGILRLA